MMLFSMSIQVDAQQKRRQSVTTSQFAKNGHLAFFGLQLGQPVEKIQAGLKAKGFTEVFSEDIGVYFSGNVLGEEVVIYIDSESELNILGGEPYSYKESLKRVAEIAQKIVKQKGGKISGNSTENTIFIESTVGQITVNCWGLPSYYDEAKEEFTGFGIHMSFSDGH